ncbi:MAG: hypothetical protein DMH00_13505 [Acidobacteria bacterium]|nr:MAG: hypothetical protein DMH00_13505 [Acidobacteriota bacterium]
MILTLSRRAEAVLKVRGSRFLGFAIPVESEEEARRMIAGLGDEHSGATHCCYAYRIGRGDQAVERTHDAGEPAGSGGAPILSVIKGRRLGNLLVAVVRYFGGTKLGARPGLSGHGKSGGAGRDAGGDGAAPPADGDAPASDGG